MIYRRMFGMPTWNVRNPFSDLDRIRQQVGNILEQVYDIGLPNLHAVVKEGDVVD